MNHSTKLLLLLLFFSTSVFASAQDQVNNILKQQQEPSGVVFEVVSAFEGTLKSAIPKIIEYSKLLRKRFPDISIAVVSHGNEQFSLTATNQPDYQKLHSQVKNLAENQDIPVHICATYADRKGVDESEFPDYINVSASGPSQITNYRELGYIHIKLSNW